ncbi:MAG: ribosomal L7Ae/L30e/S12e/Gadd45 family protein [Clostridia bacterium]|nr:ribosomal L7Ae/L30e/S12e/Gadd45 family protein [Clostridia bacterium]
MIKSNSVKKAYIASDADLKEVSSIQSLCESHEIEIDSTLTMNDIGKLCGVESDCAVCVALI